MHCTNNNVYRIEHLTKSYDNKLLANDDISLHIRRGEILGLFGANGSGKTTLVKQLIGLLSPTSGHVYLEEKSISDPQCHISRSVAYQGQNNASFGAFSFSELMIHTGIYRGLTLHEAKAEAHKLVSYFECSKISNRLRYQLSGGERKLSIVLCAFMAQRPVVILDEPSNDLDPFHRGQLWSYMRKLCKETGVTFILVTHNIDEAEDLVDRVAVMKQGRLIACSTVGDLKALYHDDVTVNLILKHGEEIKLPADAIHVQSNHWKFLLPKDEAFTSLNELFQQEGHKIDDFRISKATLTEAFSSVVGEKSVSHE